MIVFDDYYQNNATHTYTTVTIPTDKLNFTYRVKNVFAFNNQWYGGVRLFYIASNTTVYFGACYRYLNNNVIENGTSNLSDVWLVPVEIYGIK